MSNFCIDCVLAEIVSANADKLGASSGSDTDVDDVAPENAAAAVCRNDCDPPIIESLSISLPALPNVETSHNG